MPAPRPLNIFLPSPQRQPSFQPAPARGSKRPLSLRCPGPLALPTNRSRPESRIQPDDPDNVAAAHARRPVHRIGVSGMWPRLRSESSGRPWRRRIRRSLRREGASEDKQACFHLTSNNQKKSPRVAPRGKVGWWRKSTYTTIDTWYRKKLHLFGIFFQEIVAAGFFDRSAATGRVTICLRFKFVGLIRKLFTMNIVTTFAALLNRASSCFRSFHIICFRSLHDFRGRVSIRL